MLYILEVVMKVFKLFIKIKSKTYKSKTYKSKTYKSKTYKSKIYNLKNIKTKV